MNKSSIFLVFAIIAVVAVSGCTTKTETTPAGAFVGGTSGLGMSFMSNAPPTEYPECTSFDINVQVENKGEYTVPKDAASVTISGISTGTTGYGITPSTKNADVLEGRQKFGNSVTPGGQQLISFSSIGSPDFPGDTTQTVIATSCYPYQTIAMSTVCITESFVKQTTGGTELCKATGDKTVYNGGAPIQVSSISQFPVGSPINGITINLKLKDMGGGTPYAKGGTCPAPSQKEIGKITVTKMHLINLDKKGDCENKQVNMVNGEAFLSCKFSWAGDAKTGEFEDILDMSFDYGYTQTATTKVKFLNVPGQDCVAARSTAAVSGALGDFSSIGLFPVSAFGDEGWTDCSRQDAGFTGADKICKYKGYSGAMPASEKPCYLSTVQGAAHTLGFDGNGVPIKLGSVTGPDGTSKAFTNVKCRAK